MNTEPTVVLPFCGSAALFAVKLCFTVHLPKDSGGSAAVTIENKNGGTAAGGWGENLPEKQSISANRAAEPLSDFSKALAP